MAKAAFSYLEKNAIVASDVVVDARFLYLCTHVSRTARDKLKRGAQKNYAHGIIAVPSSRNHSGLQTVKNRRFVS